VRKGKNTKKEIKPKKMCDVSLRNARNSVRDEQTLAPGVPPRFNLKDVIMGIRTFVRLR